MRFTTILLLKTFFLFLPYAIGGDITVELVPSNVEVEVGNIFNLTLVVKNVPEDGKCGGFETKISYDSNVVNLTDIKLSEVGESASLKEVNLSSGKISLIWFSDSPCGNFTLAVLSFKTLKPGEINITLKDVVVSDGEGYSYKNVITNPTTITVKSTNKTVGYLILKNFKIKSKIEGILSLIVAETPVKNISGSLAFNNVSLVGVPLPLDVNIFSYYSYSIENNIFSFFAVPSEKYKNKTVFDFLKIPLVINSSTYSIYVNLWVNGKSVENISIIKERNITFRYSGLAFYIDGYKEKINISLGYSKEIKLKVCNVNRNLTNFSGYIFINNSLFKVSNYGVPEYSKIYRKINRSTVIYNNSYLYFNISIINGTNGTYSILKFTIFPTVNENISSLIYIENLSIYENNTKVSLPYKNLTVNIIKRRKNTPPKLKVVLFIEDNRKVYFRALGYDTDDEKLRYFWDFGDGKNSTLQEPVHIYSNYSSYLVSCTVWDSLNQSDKVEFILPIVNISPLKFYSINKNILFDNSKNYTIYLNLSLKNPFKYEIIGYINFIDYHNNYYPPKLQYHVKLGPNETKNLSIPVTITKPCNIKWNIVYYPLYKNKFLKNVELKYYQWNFNEKISRLEYRKKSNKNNSVKSIINKSTTLYNNYINSYTKVLNITTPEIRIETNIIRYYTNDYIISKNVVINTQFIYPYIMISLCGFIIGSIIVLAVMKRKKCIN